MDKVYEFNGDHYCNEDISDWDEKYVGDLDDLWDAMCESGEYCENTFYCSINGTYDSKEELFDDECDIAFSVEDLKF
jgi:hypothetical protein